MKTFSFDINSCIWKDAFVALLARETWLPSVYMGDTGDYSDLSKRPKPGSVMTGKKDNKNWQIALRRNHKHFVSLIHGGFGSSAVGRLTFFVLKVAALEIVRRFSKSRCPCVWRGLQALQILCYPPFKWIQRWTPVKGLVKSMQVCIISLWAFHHKYIWITF